MCDDTGLVHVDNNDSNAHSVGIVGKGGVKPVVVVDPRVASRLGVLVLAWMPLVFMGSALALTFVMLWLGIMHTDGSGSVLPAFLLTIVVELLTVGVFLRGSRGLGVSWGTRLGLNRVGWRGLLTGLVFGGGMFLVLQATAAIINMVLDGAVGSSDTSQTISGTTGWEAIFAMGIMAPFIAPVVEELLFRGAVFNGLLFARVNTWVAAIISSVFFALVHIQGFSTFNDFFTIIWIFSLAFVQCWLFARWRSLFVTMVLHVSYNGLTVLVPIVLAMLAG